MDFIASVDREVFNSVENYSQISEIIEKKVIFFGDMPHQMQHRSSKRERHESAQKPFQNYSNVNIYDNLPPDDDDLSDSIASGEYVHSKKKIRIRKPHQPAMLHTDFNTHAKEKNSPQRRSAVPPPIIVEQVRMKDLLDHMSTLQIDKEKIFYKVTRGNIKILTTDSDTFTKTMEHCKTKNLADFSHALKEDKQVRFCLYGLPPRDVAEIAAELKKFKLESTKIRLLYSNKEYPDEAIHLLS